MKLLSEDHSKRLPTIRIQRIILKNFKSVGYGEILLDCGKHFVPQGTQSDILGVYGQNGSGKTSLIEALSVLKQLLIGYAVPNIYVSCISALAKNAQLEYTFDLQYDDGRIRKVVYSFKIEALKNVDAKPKKPTDSFVDYIDNVMDSDSSIRVYDEVLSMAGDFYGDKIKLQPVIDTSSEEIKNPFLPTSKRKYFLGDETDEILMNQSVNKRMAAKSSKSYIFMNETVLSFLKLAFDSEYVEVIKELRLYAMKYLFVIDTKYVGAIGNNFMLPLFSNNVSGSAAYNFITDLFKEKEDREEADRVFADIGMPVLLPMYGPFVLEKSEFARIGEQFKNMNIVIGQLIPGMQITLKSLSETITKNGSDGVVVEMVTVRDDVEMPLRYESDGIKKIISVLDLIIRAYNQKSTTIAIDEFDSGIFEYLLGEILETFQEGGRGQFIFTSHNLRPLEVIDKKFLYFTTTNTMNRYVRLKNIGKTNNLRNVYYREIVIGEQDEELYRRTQQYKIATAFRKAGRVNG